MTDGKLEFRILVIVWVSTSTRVQQMPTDALNICWHVLVVLWEKPDLFVVKQHVYVWKTSLMLFRCVQTCYLSHLLTLLTLLSLCGPDLLLGKGLWIHTLRLKGM